MLNWHKVIHKHPKYPCGWFQVLVSVSNPDPNFLLIKTGCTGNPGRKAPVLYFIKALALVTVPSGNRNICGHVPISSVKSESKALFLINSCVFLRESAACRIMNKLCKKVEIGPIIGQLAISCFATTDARVNRTTIPSTTVECGAHTKIGADFFDAWNHWKLWII